MNDYLKDKITEDSVVACYMTDRWKRLRADAFLDLAQHMAVVGADTLQFGDTQLAPYGCVWVLARQHLRFERPVLHKERIKMLTWHKGLDGLYFIRDYQLLARGDFLSEIVSTDPQSPDDAIAERAAKVAAPRGAELELIGSHVVRYSDVDYNQHANNVRYTVWAMDALPEELVYEKFLKELTINFNKEARPGETVELWHALAPDGSHIVEGRTADHQVFIERLLFE